jgi:hypothetical protein
MPRRPWPPCGRPRRLGRALLLRPRWRQAAGPPPTRQTAVQAPPRQARAARQAPPRSAREPARDAKQRGLRRGGSGGAGVAASELTKSAVDFFCARFEGLSRADGTGDLDLLRALSRSCMGDTPRWLFFGAFVDVLKKGREAGPFWIAVKKK